MVVDRTGLSRHLLRVWERRYGAVAPTRDPGGHRRYSDADITRLRLLHAVTRAGRSIGQVAGLSTDALSRMAADDAAARAERASAGASPDASAEGMRASAGEGADVSRAVVMRALARGSGAARMVVAAPPGERRALRARLPASVRVLVGGAGAPALAAALAEPGIHVGANWSDLRADLRHTSGPDLHAPTLPMGHA